MMGAKNCLHHEDHGLSFREAQSRPSRPTRKVAHRELYDLLGVPPEERKFRAWRSITKHPRSQTGTRTRTRISVRGRGVRDSPRFLQEEPGPASGQESGQPGSNTAIPGLGVLNAQVVKLSQKCGPCQVF